jgi:citrate/tricarballylate utilization protein
MSGLEALVEEADRQFTICNACRYCEDYCPVFPALERRTVFDTGELGHLANLCHDCRACQQACMYTDPHEFAINIPALMAEARVASYERYARPRWLSRAFERGPGSLAAVTLIAFALIMAAYLAFGSIDTLVDVRTGSGALYETVSHTAMVVPALLLSAYAIAVFASGLVVFWRDSGNHTLRLADPRVWWRASSDAATLAGMRGGGGGCYFPEEEQPSGARRVAHSLVVYGFLTTFAATVSAFAAEQLFDRLPPYPVLSVPVLLGLAGGIVMTAGCVWLLALKHGSDKHLTTERAMRLEYSFLYALLLAAVTGLALLLLRDTGLMGPTLLVHLAAVMALYLTAPYGKMVHAVYRVAALLRDSQERRASTPGG